MIDFTAALNENTHTDQNEIETTNLRAITPLDVAKNQLMQFSAGVNAMQREATELEVKDEASEKRGGEMTAQTKSLKKEIEAQQELIIGEAQRFVKAVQGFTLPFRKDLEAIEAQIKRKLGDYAYRKEMDRRKAETAAQKAAAEAQKKIDREAKKAGVEPVQLPQPVIPQEAAPVRTETGTTSYVPVWDFEVVDISKVPAKYLEINAQAVRASIKAGVRELPGIKIFERMQVKTRTN
jgi:hypothetical protein